MSIGNYVFFTILFLSLATSAFAQTAGITGTVKDRTGAVLIGAMITAQNLGANRADGGAAVWCWLAVARMSSAPY